MGRFYNACLLMALAFSPLLVEGQDSDPTGWEGCVDPENRDALVTIGEKTTICLVIADGVDWSFERQYMRLHFQPIADEYSRFHVPNSYDELVKQQDTDRTAITDIFGGSNITVHAASQTSLSFQKWYYNGNSRVFPYLTAIVDVQDGVVVGIAWDDASIFCGKKQAEPNTFDYAGFVGSESDFSQPVEGCFLPKDACDEALKDGETTCDLTLHVVWTGTDSKGRSFLSSSYRYSAFPPQELLDRVGQNLPDFPDVDVNPFDNE